MAVDPKIETRERLLDPVIRVSEAIFGLIMALTFTCAISVSEAGREELRQVLAGALGCNIAWGLVDGFMFLLANFVERGRGLITLHGIRSAKTPEEGRRIIRDALPSIAASTISEEGLESMRAGMSAMNDLPEHPRLRRRDWLGAVAVFFWVFLSTFPVVIPFIVIRDARSAMRVSNIVAVVLLFIGGHALGKYAQHKPWRMGLLMALAGSVLVGLTMALGG